RRHEYPPYPGYESGMPNVYYYFVPKSGWGSERPFPSDPLNPAFVRSMDGFGLNFGCPLRLKLALEILGQLSPDDQSSCRNHLASANTHLSTVEELLWLDLWNEPVKKRRIRETTTKTYNWSVTFPA